jgi:hypothetical protein
MGDLVEKYVLIGGSANPPKETGVYNLYTVVSVSMYVNKENHCVEKAKINVPSELTQAYLADILEGYCLLDSPEALYQEIRENALITSTNAIIQALKVAFTRYKDKFFA